MRTPVGDPNAGVAREMGVGPVDERALLGRLRADIEREGLIEPGDRVVLAVSGGSDSMAMLHALVALNRAARLGWTLHVAHLNHQIRGTEAEADGTTANPFRTIQAAKRITEFPDAGIQHGEVGG